MKKTYLAIIPFLFIMLLLGGCDTQNTAQDQNIQLDIKNLITTIKTEVKFADSLEPINQENVLALYGIEAKYLQESAVYIGSGATAEEIAIFQATDDKYAADIEKAIKQRIEDKKSDFQDYVPAEMKKLADPTIIQEGNYFILCISNDDAQSAKVINGFIQKTSTASKQ